MGSGRKSSGTLPDGIIPGHIRRVVHVREVHGDPHIDVNEGNFLRMMTADEVSEMSYGNLKTKR
ncbi:hypothetical protein [Methanomethylophilus alvi]|uniref:hypothetical protein n=1 Tax=Methanomethylophilus alvi TaxID=1291540 RepID=UPI0037DD12C6